MNNHYADILALTTQKPQWFDEYAVPRFCEFTPNQVANIYAAEVALIVIACQNCGREFRVAMTDDLMNRGRIVADIKDGSLHYGDPPNMQCCPAGPTMNCMDICVLEFWRLDDDHEWVRDPSLEVMLPDGVDSDSDRS